MNFSFIDQYINNYVSLIIVLTFIVRIVSVLLNKVSLKLKSEKNIRNKKCKELSDEYSGQELTNKIYEFYKESNYNPVKDYSIKIIVFILNFLVIMGLIGMFKPITNFTDVPKEQVEIITQTYTEHYSGKSYIELCALSHLSSMTGDLTSAGIPIETIDDLEKIHNKFIVMGLDTTVKPEQGSQVMFLPYLALILTMLSNLLDLKGFTKKNNTDSAVIIGSSIISILTIALLVFKMPIIVCCYIIVGLLITIMTKIVKILKEGGE